MHGSTNYMEAKMDTCASITDEHIVQLNAISFEWKFSADGMTTGYLLHYKTNHKMNSSAYLNCSRSAVDLYNLGIVVLGDLI